MGRRAAALVIAVLAVLGVVAIPAGSAQACTGCTQGGTGGNSPTATAAVRLSGDAAPGGGATVTVSVPATCWWSAWNQVGVTPSVDYVDPTTWVPWYDAMFNTTITFVASRVSLGSRSMWEAAAAKPAGTVGLYSAECRDGAPACALTDYTGGQVTNPPPGWGNCGLTVTFGFFPVGNPPAPQVDPRDLAILARDRMVIPEPQIERNPKVSAVDQATLVGLPTWFWVTNPAAVGGRDGTRTIRAEAGAAWAEVVARTGGLTITSPAGGNSCPPEVATRAYTAGAPDASGCVVSFSHASVGYAAGYPVDTSTAWSVTWTGSGNSGGDLAGLARATQILVPVAESQALVGTS